MPACRRIIATVVLICGSALTAAAQHGEVQMARPCSRVDLTHAAARGGYLALSQPAAHSVALYDIGGDRFGLAATIGTLGKNANQFDVPSGVAIDAQRRLLFVSDTNNDRIQVFRLAEPGAPIVVSFAKSIGRHGVGLGELDHPTAITLDGAGNLFVIDKGNRRVQVFAPDLSPARVFGSGDELRDPIGIAAARSGGAVYVADAGLRRVQIFGGDGRLRNALGKGRGAGDEPGTAGAFFYPADLAVSNDGTVLVTDCGDHVVQRFDARGGVLTSWGHFNPDDGGLNQPRAITVDERDRVIVFDFSSRRAQLFSPTGAFVRAVNLVSGAKGAATAVPSNQVR